MLHIITFGIPVSYAKDYGIRGPVYEIVEDDLLSLIQERLKLKQANGEWKHYQKQVRDSVTKQTRAPKRVRGITSATQSRQWTFDPTWVLSQSIVDHEGRVIAEKGKPINPLDIVPLQETLFFIDASVEKEICFVEKILQTEQKIIKVILTNGDVADLTKRLDKEVYFDQNGRITGQFGIHHTPAIAKQQGRVLQLEEIALS